MKLTYFEDYRVGATLVTPARVVAASDIQQFAELSGDRHRLHLDPEFGRASIFGERIAHGLLGLSFVNGLAFASVIDSDYVLAFLSLSWRFTGPIRIGDAVHAALRIHEARPTRKPDRGLVVLAIQVLTEGDACVQEGDFTFLIARRPTTGTATDPSAAPAHGNT